MRLGGQQLRVQVGGFPAAVRGPAELGAVRGFALAEQQVIRLALDPLAGPTPSIGTVGDAYDNALAETTIGLYKTECIREGSPFGTAPLMPLISNPCPSSRAVHSRPNRAVRASSRCWETIAATAPTCSL